jgi:threonylcarbamoyladenosine tRNA methylthiotransferase MtaB
MTPDRYRELILRIKQQIPGIAVTTDIMTGFPGETDSEFQENLEFVKEMDFTDGHVFTYSAREGTDAFEYPDQVSHAVRKERSALIREIIKKSNQVFRQKHLDAEIDVLWERSEMLSDKEWNVIGLTDNYIRVEAKAELDLWNRFSPVRITEIITKGVRAEII